MDVFKLRNEVIGEYGRYVRSFVRIRDPEIDRLVDEKLTGGFLWPDPLVQLNPSFEPGKPMAELVADGILHPQCFEIFRQRNDQGEDVGPLRLHRHQVDAVAAAREGENYLLTTGTGSGKSLSYIVPIVDHVLREGSGQGIRALIVYPMNALANSQVGELGKFLCPDGGRPPVTFRRYTGQEKDVERKAIQADPPDVLLTNYVMLELILTRPSERPLVAAMAKLRFLVLDELHSYRGRQGADVAMLVRRLREASGAREVLHVGTSATLAAGDSWRQQQVKVAELAETLFGVPVRPERVIGEMLQPATGCADDDSLLAKVRARLDDEDDPPADAGAFRADPLAAWIESHLGLRREPQSGRLIRGKSRALRATADELAQRTGVDRERCLAKLEATLLAGYRCGVFAFRLHQFLAKGESVYATLESEERREATLEPQRFAPGSGRAKILLPLAFCRECGQEYYVVRRSEDEDGPVTYLPRDLSDRGENDDGKAGFLYLGPWPTEPAAQIAELPDSWTELRGERLDVVRARRDDLPRPVRVSLLGVEGGGEPAWHLEAPFRFCLRCKVAYDAHQRSDFAKLATLGSEGRSTATTVLTLSTVRRLRGDAVIEPTARKLLSFTDNRQDASLQAGHFNDFVEIVLLRSALWRAVREAGEEGLRHDVLTRRVFDALELPLPHYARNPRAEYGEREDTDRALRRVIGYYLYRDLRRGWRITSPNLEQCGLLDIDYLYLRPLCEDHEKWRELHPALATATAEERERVCRVLLDHLRRELAIRVDYLDPTEQESLGLDARQRLADPWT
ncbi:MAG: DEAD/DEAH box helicase, partial [bacterium]|nr:DEAD/DEAH box helicase [bacterium]